MNYWADTLAPSGDGFYAAIRIAWSWQGDYMLPNAYLCAELGEPTDPFEIVDKLIDAAQLGPLVEVDLYLTYRSTMLIPTALQLS